MATNFSHGQFVLIKYINLNRFSQAGDTTWSLCTSPRGQWKPNTRMYDSLMWREDISQPYNLLAPMTVHVPNGILRSEALQ